MERWLETGFDQVKEALAQDGEYQTIVAACSLAEKGYMEVVEKLTEQEQQIIEDYIALCGGSGVSVDPHCISMWKGLQLLNR